MHFIKRNNLKSFEIALGHAVFDLQAERLNDRSGAEIVLRYRSRQVLKHLVCHRGEIVGRAALVQAVWDVDTVSDDSVAQCIADIRRALNDTSKRLLETIPRKGYRLEASRAQAMPTTTERPALPQKSVLAVLPFEDHDIAGVQSTALRAAMAEAIITDLARYPEMAVISRAASFQFGAHQPIAAIFSRLKADYVLTGALQSDGAHGRVNLQLISKGDYACVWADDVDFQLQEILALTQSIGRHVANVVGAKVIDMAEAQLERGDLSAILIENAARSRMLRHRSKNAWRQNLIEQEVALDHFPDSEWGNFGQALAIRVGIEAGWQTKDVDAASHRAQTLIARALATAPKNYLVHYALGRMHAGNGDMTYAIAAFETAARLNPSSTLVLSGLVIPYLYLGETSRALGIIAQAEQIDPFHTDDLVYKKALSLWQAGDLEGARDTLLTFPGLTIEDRKLLAVVQLELGQTQAARDALMPFLDANPDWTVASESQNQKEKWTPDHLRRTWVSHLESAGLRG
ncbi:MAG: winged helix-turn-helix domain-containing protein [Paracoccaceae bacterium]